MKTVIYAIAGSIALVAAVIFSPVNNSSASEDSEETQTAIIEDADISALISALKKAEREIEDEDLKEYYALLIEKYDLYSEPYSETLNDTYAKTLPDIDHVVRVAITTPLEQAGKNIKDPEIKAFYYDFLEDVGWEFE
ncbi:MAG: hypothetical protein JW712_03000 [Dehalococcoidales bacterium]|nr:hypothetical protein [Dehalococcoidales bacterium]